MVAQMDKSITDIDQVIPAWLTERLRSKGHLAAPAEVTKIQVESSSQNSTNVVAHLNVEYSPGIIDLPSRLFFKTGDADMCVDCEVWFHDDILAYMDASPTIPCFDAVWDRDAGRGHLVFEDVSQTHYHGKGRIHPALRVETERIIDAFAPFHAFWWDHSLLGTKVGRFPQEDFVLWYGGVASYEKSFTRFVDLVGDRLSKRRRILYEKVLASFPFKDLRGKSRLTPGNRLSLIHADAMYDNILLPKDPTTHTVYLIDWAFWEVRMGTDDIAHIGLYGFCEPKAKLTRELVKRYYDSLLQHGVEDYGWEDCWHDYRLSTIRHLFIPISSAVHGTDLSYDWRNLERSLRSFKDLDCAELLTN